MKAYIPATIWLVACFTLFLLSIIFGWASKDFVIGLAIGVGFLRIFEVLLPNQEKRQRMLDRQ